MADERSIDGRKTVEPRPTPERMISSEAQGSEQKVDHALRPRSLKEMIGQERLREKIGILVEAARKRGDPLDHVLLYGPPGLGKCITADSLILTAAGWQPFHELLPETFAAATYQPLTAAIYGVDGVEPTSHVYANGWGPTIRVRTRSGFEIEGTPNHPVWWQPRTVHSGSHWPTYRLMIMWPSCVAPTVGEKQQQSIGSGLHRWIVLHVQTSTLVTTITN